MILGSLFMVYSLWFMEDSGEIKGRKKGLRAEKIK